MRPAIEPVDRQELQRMLEHARAGLSAERIPQLKAACDTLVYLTQLVENKSTTIARLRQMLFGASTEKTAAVLRVVSAAPSPEGGSAASSQQRIATRHPHGRDTGATARQDYTGATRSKSSILLSCRRSLPGMPPGQALRGGTPGVLVRVVGQAPLAATVYELEKLRCNLCLEVFTAPAPKGSARRSTTPVRRA